ncbi:MAG: hypothetical protein BWY57_03499 [Betaproteobacteria bacterium ADurb.Bin341]|nr:MAG: hypothetical protein BWY57_03499 [Betaproteobacteria bacterium ADurb.Bin341]
MLRLQRVAVGLLALLELGITGVHIHAMRTADQREHKLDITAQFLRRAGAPRIIAGRLDAAREIAVRALKAAHVVALPAVQRDRDLP